MLAPANFQSANEPQKQTEAANLSVPTNTTPWSGVMRRRNASIFIGPDFSRIALNRLEPEEDPWLFVIRFD